MKRMITAPPTKASIGHSVALRHAPVKKFFKIARFSLVPSRVHANKEADKLKHTQQTMPVSAIITV